ncbi:hypothetical protein D3C79_975140 [compost metagenome]
MPGSVQGRLGERRVPQHMAHEYQRGTAKILQRHAFDDIVKGAAHPILVRPGGAMDHGNRALRAIVG